MRVGAEQAIFIAKPAVPAFHPDISETLFLKKPLDLLRTARLSADERLGSHHAHSEKIGIAIKTDAFQTDIVVENKILIEESFQILNRLRGNALREMPEFIGISSFPNPWGNFGRHIFNPHFVLVTTGPGLSSYQWEVISETGGNGIAAQGFTLGEEAVFCKKASTSLNCCKAASSVVNRAAERAAPISRAICCAFSERISSMGIGILRCVQRIGQ